VGRHSARRQLPSFSLQFIPRAWRATKRWIDKFFEHEPWREWDSDRWYLYGVMTLMWGFAGLGVAGIVQRLRGEW
jgi:hypothetical protein